MADMVILQTVYTKELKIKDVPITQHHLYHQIHIIINETVIIEDTQVK